MICQNLSNRTRKMQRDEAAKQEKLLKSNYSCFNNKIYHIGKRPSKLSVKAHFAAHIRILSSNLLTTQKN